MFNLIETQQALKGLPLNDVMKYANGNNPEVPSYLALSELQRRKQLEDTQSAFSGQQPTVKEQIESGLTALPAGQVNPTAAPTGMANPTQLPPQLAPTPVAPNKSMMTAAPAGAQPNAAPPVPKMAEGGLSELPLPHMFRQTSYADGGIVHFAEPTDATVGAQAIDQLGSELDATKARLNSLKAPGLASRVDPTALEKYNAEKAALQQEYDTINSRYQGAIESAGLNRPAQVQLNKNMRLMPVANPVVQELTGNKKAIVQRADPSVFDREDAEAGAAMNKVQATKVPEDPNKQASNTSSGQLKKNPAAPTAPVAPAAPVAPVNSLLNPDQFKQPTELSDAQLLERRKSLEKLAGVSQDPMADIKERYAKLETKRAAQEAEDPSDRLIARLAAFSGAKATEGFGAQLGESAVAGSKMQKEQEALRDKQATEMNALQMNIAKEEDARKRGDVSAVESARAAQEKTKQDLMKLGIDASNATANQINAAANTLSSQAQMVRARHEASTSKTPAEIQLIERIQKDPEFAAAYEKTLGIKGSGALIKDAQSKWDSSMALRMEWEKKGGYPAYLASQGITMPGGGGATPSAGTPKEGDKATSNSGKPIIFKNGKWEYQ
jgi:hypothetical protein